MPLTSSQRVARHMAECRALAVDGHPSDRGYGYAFARYYLPHYIRDPLTSQIIPAAEWHEDFDRRVFGSLDTATRSVFLAPRGYAKSTKVSLQTPLVALAKRLKEYVLLVQETGGQAQQAMGQVIHELDGNDRLLADFPHLARAMRRGRPIADRDTDIIFESGARIQAMGALGSLRGRRQRQTRPDLVLIDDLEDDEHVQTRYQRDKVDSWVSSALMGALGPRADVYMVGTLLHHDAVLARLMARGAPWRPVTYHAPTDLAAFSDLVGQVDVAVERLVASGRLERGEWDEDAIRSEVDPKLVERVDASSTWSEYWPALRLVAKRKEMGSAAFSREYLHEPVDESRQLFPRSRFKYRGMRTRLLEAQPGEFTARVRIGVDIGIGEKRENDYSAAAVCAQVGAAAEYDVLEVWRGKLGEDALLRTLAVIFDRWRPYSPVLHCEAVQAQAWLALGLRKYGVIVTPEQPTRDKIIRAEPSAVLYENGQVWHDDSLRDGDAEQEMTRFPAAENDDQVDALVYALDALARKPSPGITLL